MAAHPTPGGTMLMALLILAFLCFVIVILSAGPVMGPPAP